VGAVLAVVEAVLLVVVDAFLGAVEPVFLVERVRVDIVRRRPVMMISQRVKPLPWALSSVV